MSGCTALQYSANQSGHYALEVQKSLNVQERFSLT